MLAFVEPAEDFGAPLKRLPERPAGEKGAWGVMTDFRDKQFNHMIPVLWWGLEEGARLEALSPDEQDAVFDKAFPETQ